MAVWDNPDFRLPCEDRTDDRIFAALAKSSAERNKLLQTASQILEEEPTRKPKRELDLPWITRSKVLERVLAEKRCNSEAYLLKLSHEQSEKRTRKTLAVERRREQAQWRHSQTIASARESDLEDRMQLVAMRAKKLEEKKVTRVCERSDLGIARKNYSEELRGAIGTLRSQIESNRNETRVKLKLPELSLEKLKRDNREVDCKTPACAANTFLGGASFLPVIS